MAVNQFTGMGRTDDRRIQELQDNIRILQGLVNSLSSTTSSTETGSGSEREIDPRVVQSTKDLADKTSSDQRQLRFEFDRHDHDWEYNPVYFDASKTDGTTIRISDLLFRYGGNTGTYVNITGAVDDYIDLTIPTVEGEYYLFFQAVYTALDGSYSFTIEVSTKNIHPTSSFSTDGSYTWVEELCLVTVTSNRIANYEQTWPGQVIEVPISNPTTADHPFKSRMKADGTTVEVGYLRPDWKDSISIEDPDTDGIVALQFPLVEEITLDTTDYYIYYDASKGSGGWTVSLKKSATWPPVHSVGNVLIQVGFAEFDAPSGSYVWRQHQHDCPREPVQSIRGEFEPWYSEDGSVTIASGSVETFNNNSAVIAGGTYPLAVDTEIWVTLVSTRSAGTPSVTINGLNSGVFPGMFVIVPPTEENYNFKIGEIASGIYIPSHKGKLEIDNTLLQPLISDDYSAATDQVRMMAFHGDQETDVGDTSNDLLIEAEFLEVHVRGGGVEQLIESTEVKFYGLTDNSIDVEMMAVSGEDGSVSGYGYGSISLTPQDLDYETDHGLVQQIDFSDGYVAKIEAGDNVQIDYADGVATIKAKPGLGGAGGNGPYYFPTEEVTTTSVKVSDIRYRYGKTVATLADQTKSIPTPDGIYYLYLQVLYATSYTVTVEVSAVNTHPDQTDEDSSTRAWREEICSVTMAGGVISSLDQIWPGQIMSVEGRIV